MKNKRSVDICLTPSMFNLFDLSNKKVIIIDVFRATSAMCVFLNNGGDQVIPVSTIEKAEQYRSQIHNLNSKKCLVAAERNGEIVPGFDLGNSPLSYINHNFTATSLVITTTNGTLAIDKAQQAGDGMILASFLNASSVVDYILNHSDKDILITCSGWKGRFCIEDVLLAGLLSKKLLSSNCFTSNSDSIYVSQTLYDLSKHNMFDFLKDSAYRKRMNLDEDVKYCLQIDIMKVVPVWCFDKLTGGFFATHKK